MTVTHLIFREITHRKWNFLLSVLSASIATACMVGALTVLNVDRLQTEHLLNEKRKAVETSGADLEDSMRKIMKGLGFNVIILPEDQDLNELYLEGTLSRSMPEDYVRRLASSKILTINHLLPTVTKKLLWPEKNTSIILFGTRGEVPLMHKDPKKPLLDAVPPGNMILGAELARQLNLKVADKVLFMKRPFNILKVHEERGTTDDSTVWINLAEAQQLLGMENLIHAIQALECHCSGDRITEIRKEIAGILPGTQVIERGPPALARAEARAKAKATAEAALADEQASRQELQRQHQHFTNNLVPIVLTGAALWIGLLAYGNVRQRHNEIGILRALGLRSHHILGMFLGKFLITGLMGVVVGCAVGAWVGLSWNEDGGFHPGLEALDPVVFLLALLIAPTLSLVASCIPALLAARQDPAVTLSTD